MDWSAWRRTWNAGIGGRAFTGVGGGLCTGPFTKPRRTLGRMGLV